MFKVINKTITKSIVERKSWIINANVHLLLHKYQPIIYTSFSYVIILKIREKSYILKRLLAEIISSKNIKLIAICHFKLYKIQKNKFLIFFTSKLFVLYIVIFKFTSYIL